MALAKGLRASGRRDMTTCDRVLGEVEEGGGVTLKLASQSAKTDPRLAGGQEADKLDLMITNQLD